MDTSTKKAPTREERLTAQWQEALRAMDRKLIVKALKASGLPVPDSRDFWRIAHEVRLANAGFTAEERAASERFLEGRDPR